MTIPEDPASGKGPVAADGAGEERIVRPQPKRNGPRRASPTAGPQASAAGQASASIEASAEQPTVSGAVAHAVKLGYDVIAENIRQGREAAERFRQGEYNVREVPGDLEVAALRMIGLARELSSSTFDICERLLREVGGWKPQADPAEGIPPFRAGGSTAPSKPAAPGGGPGPGFSGATTASALPVTVRFVGGAGVSHTSSLARPRRPTAPADIAATPLAPRTAGADPITTVTFTTDVSIEGIVAVVALPEGAAPGVYAGLVHAVGEDVPLGVLTIEIPK